MKHYLFLFIGLVAVHVMYAASNDTCKNQYVLDLYTPADTITLPNDIKLFYMHDCDSIYAVLQSQVQFSILHALPVQQADQYDRLGLQFMKAYEECFLFQCDCPAIGPCKYALAQQDFGLVFKEFNGLIYTGVTDTLPYIMYFTDDNYIALYNVNKQMEEKFMYPVNRFNSPFPEQQFSEITILDKEIIMHYSYLDRLGKKQSDRLILSRKSH